MHGDKSEIPKFYWLYLTHLCNSSPKTAIIPTNLYWKTPKVLGNYIFVARKQCSEEIDM